MGFDTDVADGYYLCEHGDYAPIGANCKDWNPDTDHNQAMTCWGKAKQSMTDEKVMELSKKFADILLGEGNLPLAICEAIKQAVENG